MMHSPLTREVLDSSLRQYFPYKHVLVGERDREGLARRQICSIKDLSRFLGNPEKARSLEDITERTQNMLIEGSGVYSARGWLQLPMAPLSDEPCSSKVTWKSPAVKQITVKVVAGWKLHEEAQQMTARISDSILIEKDEMPSMRPIRYPSSNIEVLNACAQQLGVVNTVASWSDLPSIIAMGGGIQSFSHADLVVKILETTDQNSTSAPDASITEAAGAMRAEAVFSSAEACKAEAARSLATDESRSEAARVSAVVLTKDSSQFRVPQGKTMSEILADDEDSQGVVPLLQEAFACAVEDEVAFAGVTNYEAAVFIKRPQDVRDKTILVSDPVWLHQLYPSAFACWLTFMEQARLRHPEKPALARELVPFTGPGSRMRCSGLGQPPWNWVPNTDLYNTVLFKQPQVQWFPDSIAFEDLKEHSVLHEGTYTRVKQGMTHRVQTVVKTYNMDSRAAVEEYMAEVKIYGELIKVQGVCIPKLLYSGLVQDTSLPTLVMEHGGICLADMSKVTRKQRGAALRALKALHEVSALHGALSLDKLVWNPVENRVVLVDLVRVKLNCAEAACFEAEKADLKALLA